MAQCASLIVPHASRREDHARKPGGARSRVGSPEGSCRLRPAFDLKRTLERCIGLREVPSLISGDA